MRDYKPKIDTSLNNFYNNIYIPYEFLVLLEATKEIRTDLGPVMQKIINDAECSLKHAVQPN